MVVINEAMAKKYWPNENPLGATVTIGKGIGGGMEDRPREVVGVVGQRDVPGPVDERSVGRQGDRDHQDDRRPRQNVAGRPQGHIGHPACQP